MEDENSTPDVINCKQTMTSNEEIIEEIFWEITSTSTEEDNVISDGGSISPRLSFENLRPRDDLEAGNPGHHHHDRRFFKNEGWVVFLKLAFQSIGVVFGDLGTSPLYVYPAIFTDGIKHKDDIIGVLSLIFYTITLIPLFKYVFVVLHANDHGNGGTCAMYSLICRHAKVGFIPSQEVEEPQNLDKSANSGSNCRASKLKAVLENNSSAKIILSLGMMLGSAMVIGDGVLTPCISVLSAVSGLRLATSAMTEERIVWLSIAILIILFMLQRFGTDKVAYIFAPVLCLWFALIGGVGLYNFIKYDPSVMKALNPKYIIDYFTRNKKQAWISLGGVVLSITGTEALFADVGHFSVRSIQVSTCIIIYPALVLAYGGQASYLRKNHHSVADVFFHSIPGPIYYPVFVTAILASMIASQAMISATFSVIQQSHALGCFPRVRIIHTSAKNEGQVYIPEVNYLLMLGSIVMTFVFRTAEKIGNAYGIAVVFVMTLTSAFVVLIMILIWRTRIVLVVSYVLIIGTVELVFLSSVFYKFDQGGYLPLSYAFILMAVIYTWNYVHRKKYDFELNHKMSTEEVEEIMAENRIPQRLPGLAIFYSELDHGIPPIFKHYIANIPALHSVLVFVSIKALPISRVPIEERFSFQRVQPYDLRIFQCVVRYGYTDLRNEQDPLENLLFTRLKEFVAEDYYSVGDFGVLDAAWQAGVVHLVADHEFVAVRGAGIFKRILINYVYKFLRKNLRHSDTVFDIPNRRTIRVGMTFEL